jgi:hypothetical protein
MVSNTISPKQSTLSLWFALIFLGASFLLSGLWVWSVATTQSASTVYATILALILLGLGIVLFIRLITRPDGDLFEIVVPLTGLFLLHYPVRALFIVGWPHLTRLPINWPPNSDYYVLQGLLISTVGFVFFYLGYFWGGKDNLYKLIPKIPFPDGTQHFLWIKTLIVFSIGIYAFIILFRNGSAMRFIWDPDQNSSANIQLLDSLANFRYFALVLAWGLWDLGRRYKFLAILFLVISILIGLGIGSKNDIFISLLAVLLALHYTKNMSRTRLFGLSAVLATGFVFIFFPLVQNYRQTYLDVIGFRTTREVTDLVDVVGLTSFSNTTSATNGNYIQSSMIDIVNRSVWLNAIVMINWRVPNYIEYQSGTTFYPLLIGWIPRVIWPDKPILSQGSFMHNVIIGSNTQSNVGLTSIGDFYLNFSLLGVIIGMFVLGSIVRIIYLYTQNFSQVKIYQILFYFTLYPNLLFSLQSGVATGLLGIVRISLVVMLVITFLSLGASKKHVSKPL